MCLGCVYLCPQKALVPGKLKFVIIDEGFSLSDSLSGGENVSESDLRSEAKGWLWAGVRKYIFDRSDILG